MMRRSGVASRKGSVMVEFTLSMMFLIPLFLGLWEFGFAFYRYSSLENAVRAGARYASLRRYDSATITPSAGFLSAVQKVTVYGSPTADAGTAAPIVPGLTTDNVRMSVAFVSGYPRSVTVYIDNYQLPTYIGTVTLRSKPYVWFPYMGTFGPP
jgi:Flp pilus assembly protein TadG